MTENINLLQEVHGVLPIEVQLPNGAYTLTTKRGLAYLNPNITLKDVLYVPQLNCNLIPVGQLIEDLSCIVTFTNQHYVIQDLTSRSPIGVGELKRGVYCFKDKTATAIQVNRVSSYELWHQCLGHPSRQALSKLFSGISKSSSSHKADLCNVCVRAKQTRSSFQTSDNIALNKFDLIHIDIWGAYRVKAFCVA